MTDPKALREKLQSQILELLKQYQADTGLTPVSIDVNTIEHRKAGERHTEKKLCSVYVEVRL